MTTTAEMIASLDYDAPQRVKISWGLDQAQLTYGESVFCYHRALTFDLQQHLKMRGYVVVEEDIDPRGGIEGMIVYFKK